MSGHHDHPAPLVPADTDIAGLSSFMLDVERLFASELWACSTGEEFKAAMALWGRAWQQRPAGSLPNDDRVLAAFSGTGTRWRKVKAMALRGFVLCSDNRYYHRVLCEDVMRAAKHKEARRERTAAATKARQAKGDGGPKPPSGGKKVNGNNETGERNVNRDDNRNDDRNDDRNEVRHEQRSVVVTDTSREPLRSPIDRTGQDVREEDNTGDRSDPVPRAAGGAVDLNSKAGFNLVERRCREVLPGTWVCDPLVSPMVRLVANGLDLEAEIIPALIDVVAGTRTPIRTWTLLANRVAERVAVLRQSREARGLAAKPPTPVSEAEKIDLGVSGRWPEDMLRRAIQLHRDRPGSWTESLFGPPPGQPGCRVPARLLIGEAA